MKWNGEAEEALSRLIEGREIHDRNRAEAEARRRVEARAKEDGVEEIDARLVVSTLAREAPREDQDRVKKVIRSLGMKTEEFF